ncbi:T9SS type B sorting domain-containing protein [Epilithonimonas caeni]|uniref:T9SS type B sorting domain-containing protein n=1 Tax=Epilithonimonas caeni TaxID=365343 RepID=UPI000484A567|nr:T9SS type B sorting domain-containing protein [Epilithonimonas caeni]
MKKISSLFFFLLFTLLFSQNKEANDCVNYIQICGNQTITLNPTGYGIQELDSTRVCKSEEHNSLWLKFTVKTAGKLGFDLIPTSPAIEVDYDFWIFGPNVSCGNIGFSVRCSTTNPEAAFLANNHTGMRDTEPAGDFSEGPGKYGDGYIKSLDVLPGESYFLVIDRPIGNGSFTLNWTGTALLEDPFGTASNPFGVITPIAVCNPNLLYDFSLYTTNILNNNPDFDISYYNSYEDATYDENRITSPVTLLNHDYYYRIQSTVTECFRVETIKVDWKPLVLSNPEIKACRNSLGQGTFNLNSAILTSESTTSIKYYLTLEAAQDHIPGTEIQNPARHISNEGSVFAWVINNNGCENSAEIYLKFYPVPNIDTSLYNANLCDNDLDNSISLRFSDITPIIINNPNDFEVYYYLTSNTTSALPDDFTFTQNTPVLVEVRSKNGCPSAFGTINFKIAPQIVLNGVTPVGICDSDRSGNEPVDLSDYSNLFTTKANSITFYETLDDAKKTANSIPAIQDLKADKNYFIRFENNIDCPAIGELKLIFKNPKISNLLKDEIICKENKIILEAGPGFDGYLWSSGSGFSTSGPLGVGEHWVDLTYDGCTTRQKVNLIAEDEVIIKILEIENNTLTVTATGGTAPYEYSLDGTTWQFSNIFNQLSKGIQKVFVRSAKKCIPSVREFSNINLVNIITPNGDGKNDILDYSSLSLKNNATFKIANHYGQTIFTAKDGKYIWDGKHNGRILPTASYWYTLEWTEPNTGVIHKYNSWILLKNR